MTSLNEWIETKVRDGDITYFEYDEFINLEKTGEGAFGTVKKADWRSGGIKIALKVLANNPSINEDNMNKFLKELKNLRKVSFHPNINQFYGISKEPLSNNYIMVLQYANQGNLREYLKNNFDSLQWKDKVRMALDITFGLKYLHSREIIHRDLHAKNILVHDHKLVIADLGLSKQLSNDITSNSMVYGMPAYVEPQCYKIDNYVRDKKSDIYSLGVLLWEITSGSPPFSRSPPYTISFKVASGSREQPIINTPLDYVNLYKKCWNDDPNLRPNIDDVYIVLKEMSSQLNTNTTDNHAVTLKLIENLNKLGINSDLVDQNSQSQQSQSSKSINDHNYDLTLSQFENQISTPLSLSSVALTKVDEKDSEISNMLNEIIRAYLYFNEIGKTKSFDFDKIFKKYESNSEKIFNYLINNSTIPFYEVMVGKFYNEGFGKKQDDDKAFDWYMKASQKQDTKGYGHFEVGYYYYVKANYEKSIENIQFAINCGLNRAYYFLAYLYKFGLGNQKANYFKAFELYEKSSKNGFILSQHELAECYKNGIGTQKNAREALKWYKEYKKNDGELDVSSKINNLEKELLKN
ncbi:kinase-like domain-containing protein [Glomus cerebriforme]|uniref:Kinase-like domain-containing protein n=1 Tax=Glomus cerebriforme TaxID=658196 RepID=A0A397SP15_9GLOM|nr:kinase-like domain-containing protein [Glomus cerebriforme]